VPGYEIDGELGRGGMGVVYRARHLALKRTVALKMVLAGGLAGPHELARFRIEAEAVARLQHPNIVQIHEVGEAGGHPYFALEFVEGGTLAARVRGRPMSPRGAAQLVESLARAMQLAHSRNVVHRDLKPANVLLAADGTPKISDFGLARQMDRDSGETQAGAVMGTPSYMAPEQAAGRANEAGPAADVYALGAILYTCVTGRPPFLGATSVETLDQVRTKEPPPPSRWRTGVPLDLETICLKCLRKEPESRYASAAELADELQRFQRGEPILARPVGAAERLWKWAKRSPSRAAFSAAIVTLVLLVAGTSTMLAVTRTRANRDLRREQGEKDRALRNERIISARLALDSGQLLCEQGDVARGLVAMSAGLPPAIDAEAHDVESAIRHNLAAWEREQWPLQAIDQGPPGVHVVAAQIQPRGNLVAVSLSNGAVELWPLGDQLPAERKRLAHESTVEQVEFSADGRRLLTRTRRAVRVWDTAAGTAVGPPFDVESTDTAVISPDGAAVATAGRVARLWVVDAISPTVRELPQTAAAHVARFRPDGRELLTSDSHLLRRWEVATGKPLGEPMPHANMVWSAAYSRDGRRIVSCSRTSPSGSAVIYLWDGADGRLLFESRWDGNTAPEVLFSPDGQSYAAISGEGAVQIRRTATGAVLPGPPADYGAIKSMSYSLDGATLMLGGRNGQLHLWDVAAGRSRGPILHHQSGVVNGVIYSGFSDDGQTFVSLDGALRQWRPAAGTRRGPPLVHSSDVLSLGFSPDGGNLITGSLDGTARVWSTSTGERVAELAGQGGPVFAVAFTPDGRRAFTAGGPTARIWDTKTWTIVARLDGHMGMVLSAAVSLAGDIAVTGGSDQTARLWNLATGQLVGAPLTHSGPVRSLAFRPDGLVVLCGCADGTARLWRVTTGKLIGELRAQGGVEFAGFSPDGRLAITAGFDPEVRLWDADSGRPAGSVPAPNAVCQSVAASRDGQYILAGGYAPSIRLRDLATGDVVGLPLQHRDAVRAVTFAPGGDTVLTGSLDGTGRRWHVPTGFPVGPELRHTRKLRVVEFSPDGRLCATGGWDGTASVWVVPPPVAGDPAAVRFRVEQAGGLALEPDGSVRVLDAAAWRDRQAAVSHGQ
jgi:WD40 repeat protein